MIRCPYVCMYESIVSAKYWGYCHFPSERWQQLSVYQCKSRTWIDEKGEGSGYFIEPDLLHHTLSALCPLSSFSSFLALSDAVVHHVNPFPKWWQQQQQAAGIEYASSPCRTLVLFYEALFRLPFCPSFTALRTGPGFAGDGSQALICLLDPLFPAQVIPFWCGTACAAEPRCFYVIHLCLHVTSVSWPFHTYMVKLASWFPFC